MVAPQTGNASHLELGLNPIPSLKDIRTEVADSPLSSSSTAIAAPPPTQSLRITPSSTRSLTFDQVNPFRGVRSSGRWI